MKAAFFKAWQTAGDLAAAYGIGRSEANAAFNLLNHVDGPVVLKLTEYVKFLEAVLRFASEMINGFKLELQQTNIQGNGQWENSSIMTPLPVVC